MGTESWEIEGRATRFGRCAIAVLGRKDKLSKEEKVINGQKLQKFDENTSLQAQKTYET